jgi:hypothetical protein
MICDGMLAATSACGATGWGAETGTAAGADPEGTWAGGGLDAGTGCTAADGPDPIIMVRPRGAAGWDLLEAGAGGWDDAAGGRDDLLPALSSGALRTS